MTMLAVEIGCTYRLGSLSVTYLARAQITSPLTSTTQLCTAANKEDTGAALPIVEGTGDITYRIDSRNSHQLFNMFSIIFLLIKINEIASPSSGRIVDQLP